MRIASISVRSIFLEAVEQHSAAERPAYLDRACGHDPAVRREVEDLLRAHAEQGGPLDHLTSTSVQTAEYADSREVPGTEIGPYKLMDQIGEGGMGVVYMAEQTSPVRRTVALKVIRPGMDTRKVVARFEAERQALALMNHPNIARVLDGGATELGRPYFVMELVHGVPITDYCDRHRLAIPERLELFLLVCRAVQHAHQKGIIHRDLKPSNILVSEVDGVAVPKVIDFGVAKAMTTPLTERTLCTDCHQILGTPLYMSPEQADVGGEDIDTRSDIYALGVLLYELLTGTTPFEQETFRTAGFDEMRRILREQEPPRPSQRLSSLGAARTTVSANRRANDRRLDRAVRGELDWIVMKAMEKDRRRRYETANDFAADVMRFLTDLPVEACKPSPWYRFTKFARRNRASLSSAALVFLALVVATTVSLWQAVRASQAAGEARERADELKQVVGYLAKDIYGVATPGKRRSRRSVTVGELLDHADATLGDRYRLQPLVEASVRMALAGSAIVEHEKGLAEQNVARAVQIRERFLGPEDPATLEALSLQAWLLCCAAWDHTSDVDIRNNRTAESIARRVLASSRRVPGPAHSETLRIQARLAHIVSNLGRHEEAEVLAAEVEGLAIRYLSPEHEVTLLAQHILGLIAERRGNLARADALFRHVIEGCESSRGTFDITTIYALERLANVVRLQGRADEARQLHLEAVNRFAEVYGLCGKPTGLEIMYLFSLLEEQRDLAAIRDLCEGWIREILAMPPEPDRYDRYRRSVQLSGLALRLAMLPAGIPYDAGLALRAAKEAAALHDDWDDAWTVVGVLYYRTGQIDEAMQAIRKSMSRPRSKGGDDFDWLMLAPIYARRGELDQARTWYDKARNRPDPVDFNREDLRPLRDEAATLIDDQVPSENGRPKPSS